MMVCSEEIWHAAWPGPDEDRLLGPRWHTFCTHLCTADWTLYNRLDLMMKTIFQSALKSDKTLITEEILEDVEDFLKLRWISMDWPAKDAICTMEIHRRMNSWVVPLHLNLVTWLSYGELQGIVGRIWNCTLSGNYDSSTWRVKKWRPLNHPWFSVKIVCFVSSCGVYALDDH